MRARDLEAFGSKPGSAPLVFLSKLHLSWLPKVPGWALGLRFIKHMWMRARAWSSCSGWEMPLDYGSPVNEHTAVRTDAGMFDISHLGIIDVAGADFRIFLRQLLANDVNKLTTVGGATCRSICSP